MRKRTRYRECRRNDWEREGRGYDGQIKDAKESKGTLERQTSNIDTGGWRKGVGWLGRVKGECRRAARRTGLDVYCTTYARGWKDRVVGEEGRKRGWERREEQRIERRRRRRRPASKEITIFAYVNYRLTRMNDRPQ